jgi:putative membrane protein
MFKFILRWIINAVAIYIAINFVPGIRLANETGSEVVTFILLAMIFGLLNALLRPIIMALTCPLIVLTLGLGTLLVNTLLFYLTGVIGEQFGWGFTVDGFIPAFLGALVVSIVSFVLNLFVRDSKRDDRRR